MKSSIKFLSLFSLITLFFTVNVLAQKEGTPWNIPAKYKAMKSTVKAGDPSVNTVGKEMYNKHCKSCHGAKGLGDGPKSATLKTIVPPFNDKKFQAQTDGEIYYQSFVGKDEMPNFEKKIVDEDDRWAVVQYIRTMK